MSRKNIIKKMEEKRDRDLEDLQWEVLKDIDEEAGKALKEVPKNDN